MPKEIRARRINEAITQRPHSRLPYFLALDLHDDEYDILWSALSNVSLRAYATALDYERVSGAYDPVRYFREVLASMDAVCDRMPSVQAWLVGEENANAGELVAIAGLEFRGTGFATLAVGPVTQGEDRVRIVATEEELYGVGRVWSKNSAFGAAPRRFGLEVALEAIDRALSGHRVRGGPVWAREQLLWHVAEERIPWDTPVARLNPSDEHSAEILKLLSEEDRSRTLDSLLLPPGDQHPPGAPADKPFVICHWLDQYSDQQFTSYVGEYLMRVALCYREVVEYSFSEIAGELLHYPTWPGRWEVKLVRDHGLSMRARWLPVDDWQQVRVDVVAADRNDWLDPDSTREVLAELQRLGRPDHAHLVVFSVVPLREPKSEGTPVSQVVLEMLRDDIKHLTTGARSAQARGYVPVL